MVSTIENELKIKLLVLVVSSVGLFLSIFVLFAAPIVSITYCLAGIAGLVFYVGFILAFSCVLSIIDDHDFRVFAKLIVFSGSGLLMVSILLASTSLSILR